MMIVSPILRQISLIVRLFNANHLDDDSKFQIYHGDDDQDEESQDQNYDDKSFEYIEAKKYDNQDLDNHEEIEVQQLQQIREQEKLHTKANFFEDNDLILSKDKANSNAHVIQMDCKANNIIVKM